MDYAGVSYPDLSTSDRSPMSEAMDTPALTVREVAVLLNVDEKTVYRLAKRGELPGFKVAGAWRFKRDDINAWIEKQKTAAR
jgi:excisionase family DNA binding protein